MVFKKKDKQPEIKGQDLPEFSQAPEKPSSFPLSKEPAQEKQESKPESQERLTPVYTDEIMIEAFAALLAEMKVLNKTLDSINKSGLWFREVQQ